MKSKQVSPLGLSAAGVGPRIMLTMLPLLVAGIIIQIVNPLAASIGFLNPHTLKIAGWVLMVPGILIWVCAVIQFAFGFPKGKLITKGAYSLSRNPIYSSWILFILPGIAMVFDNWIFLLAAAAMFVAFEIFIKEEEKQMLEHFGDLYKEYSKKVARIF